AAIPLSRTTTQRGWTAWPTTPPWRAQCRTVPCRARRPSRTERRVDVAAPEEMTSFLTDLDRWGSKMKITKAVLAGVVAATVFSGATHAQSQPPSVKNIVLVHGAFADGSSWAKVIPILEKRGFHAVAVQNPL